MENDEKKEFSVCKKSNLIINLNFVNVSLSAVEIDEKNTIKCIYEDNFKWNNGENVQLRSIKFINDGNEVKTLKFLCNYMLYHNYSIYFFTRNEIHIFNLDNTLCQDQAKSDAKISKKSAKNSGSSKAFLHSSKSLKIQQPNQFYNIIYIFETYILLCQKDLEYSLQSCEVINEDYFGLLEILKFK